MSADPTLRLSSAIEDSEAKAITQSHFRQTQQRCDPRDWGQSINRLENRFVELNPDLVRCLQNQEQRVPKDVTVIGGPW